MRLRQLLSRWFRRCRELFFGRFFRRFFRKKISNNKTLGQRGEDAAAKFLRRQGYKIIARNRQFALGELDIVVLAPPETVVFVEVKTRESHIAGRPEDAVDLKKQKKLTRLAVLFLKRHGLLGVHARFDVVAITWPSGVKKPAIKHFKNAFEAVGFDGFYS
jgi:putative endonuclease